MDKLSPAGRSQNMRRIRSNDTQPEMVVRRMAHAMGYRFRLHRRDLPGKPDLVFPASRKAIFVHGCFWHQHPGCREGRVPSSNAEYWQPKFERTVERDAMAQLALTEAGWSVLVLWECDVSDDARTREALAAFLAPHPLALPVPQS
jgi:DNA mismatch endonuclease (patch repair protein)